MKAYSCKFHGKGRIIVALGKSAIVVGLDPEKGKSKAVSVTGGGSIGKIGDDGVVAVGGINYTDVLPLVETNVGA